MSRFTFPALFLLPALAGAQLDPPSPPKLIGARSLALSPAGDRIAFSYQGDIWVADSRGGKAVPITNNIEMDDNPIWSPDGKWIAFASNRTGNWDIFVVPADGGTTRRLTWATSSDIPSEWSADGKSILERTTRDDPNNGIYSIDVKTGKTKQVFLDMMSIGSPHLLADGKVLYTRFGFPFYRPRYEGSSASQLWTYDPATGKRTSLRNNGFQHLWPTVLGKDVLAVTVAEKTPATTSVGKTLPKNVDNVKRTPNVYDVTTGRRLTDFVSTGTRYLTSARDGKTYAFEDDGTVYVGHLGEKPAPINLTATLDDKTIQEEHLVMTSGSSQPTLSPKGDKLVFQIRGELWLVPTKKDKGPNADDAVQLTDWAGTDEQPLWSTDNKTIFFVSDREGSRRLYRLETETKAVTPVTTSDGDVSQLRLTPDKLKVSFWLSGSEGGLYTIPVAGGKPTEVISQKGNFSSSIGQPYDWSPDGRYVAYSDVLARSGYYYWDSTTNVYIFDTQTGKKVNVTRLSARHDTPAFTPDGRYLLISSNREGDGIYAIPLKPEDARLTEMELKYEKPKDPVKVEIDFEGIELRSRRIISQAPQGRIVLDKENGEIFFLSQGDVWKAAYDGSEVRRLNTGGGVTDFDFSDDNTKLVLSRGGQTALYALHTQDLPANVVAFRADWTRDLRVERQAAFRQFWREYNSSFYDPNFHARDWSLLKQRYEKFLPSVGHRNEMATVLNLMVGELESSHSEVSPAAGNPGGPSSAHLGFLVDYSYDGPGIKIKEVPARTPGSFAKSKLEAGEVVTQINGKAVQLDEALYRDVLNDQVGRDIRYTVRGKDNKTREVKFRAVSPGDFSGNLFELRLEARRKYVEEKSGGKLTYVHIAGMGGGELRRFNQQVWEYTQGKKGLIIDVRNNGGGNTSDQLIDVLERKPNSYYQPRGEDAIAGPGQALSFPMVVMHAETSFSNAEMFPAAMKSRELATLVGKPTPGYVIYTGGFQLVDGTNARMPGTGVWRLDGTPMEDQGQKPDFDVDISPEDYFAGRDPQLDKAIEVLLRKI